MKLVIILITLSIAGFIVKLPSVFAGLDKELHFAFYFFASAFLSITLVKRSSLTYLACILLLFSFGVFIECAQEISNDIIGKRIHGKFDPQDIRYNIFGIFSYLFLWSHYKLLNKIGEWKSIQNG